MRSYEYATQNKQPDMIDRLQMIARSKHYGDALGKLSPCAHSYIKAYREYYKGLIKNRLKAGKQNQK